MLHLRQSFYIVYMILPLAFYKAESRLLLL